MLEIRPLRTRPELYNYVHNEANLDGPLHGIGLTTTRPYGLLTTNTSFSKPGEISIELNRVPGAASNTLHYAGSQAFSYGMFFYTKKAGLIFEQNYILLVLDVMGKGYQILRETESPKAMFFHRQPYYLLRIGLLTSSWSVKHFEDDKGSMTVNLAGISTDNAIFLHKRVRGTISFYGRMFILRQGDRKKLCRMEDNLVIMDHPDFNMKCTAYVDPDRPLIYVALSTVAGLTILRTDTLVLQRIALPSILDIRYAIQGELIFANVPATGTALSIGKLEEEDWKVNEDSDGLPIDVAKGVEDAIIAEIEARFEIEKLTMAGQKISTKPKDLPIDVQKGVETAILEMLNARLDIELARQEKEKANDNVTMRDLPSVTKKVDQLRKEVALVRQLFENERKMNTIREKEHQKEVEDAKKEAYDLAIQRLIRENGLSKIKEERDLLAEEKDELQKKYRRMLLLFGRQPDQLQHPTARSVEPVQEDVTAANTDKMVREGTEKSEEQHSQPNDTKKRRKKRR